MSGRMFCQTTYWNPLLILGFVWVSTHASADDTADDTQTLVRWNNGSIKASELSYWMNQLHQDTSKQSAKKMLDAWVDQRLLAQYGKSRINEHAPARQATKHAAVTLWIRDTIEKDGGPKSIPQTEIRKYFAQHKQELSRPEQRRASHILVDDKDKAIQLLKDAQTADIPQFKQLAREVSIDPQTKMRGGDLGYLSRPSQQQEEPIAAASPNMDPAVEAVLVRAAFALKEVGDTTEQPIQVGNSYSILKLTAVRPAENASLTEHAATIAQQIWLQKKAKLLDRWEQRLRRQHKVQSSPELADLVRLPDRPLPGLAKTGP